MQFKQFLNMQNGNNSFQTDCERFKHLLEFFVAYMNYTIHNTSGDRYKKTDTPGYEDYIKPIVKTLRFTGQGYKGHEIQDPLEGFDVYGVTCTFYPKLSLNLIW